MRLRSDRSTIRRYASQLRTLQTAAHSTDGRVRSERVGSGTHVTLIHPILAPPTRL